MVAAIRGFFANGLALHGGCVAGALAGFGGDGMSGHNDEDATPELFVLALWLFVALAVAGYLFEVLHG
jgi:hypothetical protein